NFPPAKIFSSATGSLPYGFLIGVLSILNQTKFATTIIVLLLPLVDFAFVILKRFIKSRPRTVKEFIKSPVQLMRMADTNHLHHQLLKLNMTNKQILLAELLVTILACAVAVFSAEAFRLFVVLGGGFLLGIAL